MIAVAVLLFGLLGKSERSIRDANIGARQDVARRLFTEDRRKANAPAEGRREGHGLRSGGLAGDMQRATKRAQQLLASQDIERIVLVKDRDVLLKAGDKTAVAPDWLPLKTSKGMELGALYVSVTDARDLRARRFAA